VLPILHEIVDHISMILRNAVSLDSSAIAAIPKVHVDQVVGQVEHLYILFGVVDRIGSFYNYSRVVFLVRESTVLVSNSKIVNTTIAWRTSRSSIWINNIFNPFQLFVSWNVTSLSLDCSEVWWWDKRKVLRSFFFRCNLCLYAYSLTLLYFLLVQINLLTLIHRSFCPKS